VKKITKIIGCILAATLFLTGCAGEQGENGKDNTAKKVQTAQTEESMGRYLEEEVQLPEEIGIMGTSPKVSLQKREDGSLAVLEQVAGLYLSSDNGQSWEHQELPWLQKLAVETYIAQIAQAPDGSMAVIYSPLQDDDEQEETLGETVERGYHPLYLYINKNGESIPMSIQVSGNYISSFWFGNDNRLFACDLDGKVYIIKPEQEAKKEIFETDGIVDFMCFTDRYLIAFASRSMAIYDLEQEILIEDKVFTDFLMDSIMDSIGANTDSYSVVAAPGEENVVYFAFDKGIYRHVIGGSAVEQVADGSLNSLGDPQMQLRGMAVLPNNEFMILYSNAKMYHYTYHPDVPTVPNEQITIYSLHENYTIRQASSLYQKSHPEVYIKYQIGLTGSDGMSKEDAIKNLNTEMMYGNGPDLLVLDDLPWKSYEQKGILEDLTSITEELKEKGNLFPNLVDAFLEDGKIYKLPIRFRIPTLVGDPKWISNITDLDSLADAVEKIRKENPEGAIIGLKTEEEVLYTLGLTSSAEWVNQDGQINKEVLQNFLENARRIYQAEIAGLDPLELEKYRQTLEENEKWSSDVLLEGHYYASAYSNIIDIAMKSQKMGAGAMHSINPDFNTIDTVTNQEDNVDYVLWQGQTKNGFIPKIMVGLCANSGQKELAEEFYRFLFSEELQDLELPEGFPVVPHSFENQKVNPIGEDMTSGIVISDENGDVFSLETKWAAEEAFDRLIKIVKSLDQACLGDSSVEEIVREVGSEMLDSSARVEDIVEEICKKAAIYLAE